MQLGVRVAYPERGEYDWYEALKPYPAVEVAFRDPDRCPSLVAQTYHHILAPWHYEKPLPRVLSVHMAHAKPQRFHEFWACLSNAVQLAKEWKTSYLVVHPQNGKLDDLRRFLDGYVKEITQPDVFLCWETFLSKRRFVNTIESIAEAGLHACYDTSHMRRDSEGVLNDLETYRDTIKVVHLSNFDEHGQHLPLRQGVLDMRTILVYLDKNFDGPVILEYLQKYHHLYLDDIRWAWEKVLK